MRFHNMQADTLGGGCVTAVKPCNGDETAVTCREVFRSYYSIVAAYDGERNALYLFPRHKYSPTTTRQVNRWIRERVPDSAEKVKCEWFKDAYGTRKEW